MFQSPKTGLCFSHTVLRVLSLFIGTMFQSPKTGLCYFHIFLQRGSTGYTVGFNPLKRVYAFLTARLLIAKNKNQKNSFYFPFNNQISPLLIYRLFENKMFGDNLQYFTKKYPYFTCKNTPIVPPHSGDSLPGFSHFPRVLPNSKIRKKHNHIKTYQIFLYATEIVVTFLFSFITCKKSRRKSYFNSLKRVYAFLTAYEQACIAIMKNMFQSPKTGLCYSHCKATDNEK